MKSHVSKMGIPVYGSSKGTIVLGDNTLGNEKNQANCCLRETSASCKIKCDTGKPQ